MLVCAKMATSERKLKKRNFTDCETETDACVRPENRFCLVAMVLALPTKENVLSDNMLLQLLKLPVLRAEPCRR